MGEVTLGARVAEVLVELEAIASEDGDDAVGADVATGAVEVSAGPKIVVIVVLVWYSTPGIEENEEEDGAREELLFSVRVAGALLCSACVDVSEGPKTVTMVVVVLYAMPGTEENEELAARVDDPLLVSEESCALVSADATAELDGTEAVDSTVLFWAGGAPLFPGEVVARSEDCGEDAPAVVVMSSVKLRLKDVADGSSVAAASPLPNAGAYEAEGGSSEDCKSTLVDTASEVGFGVSTLVIMGLVASDFEGAWVASGTLVGTSLKVVCSMVEGGTVTIGRPAVFSNVIAGAVERTTVGSSGTTSP